MNPFGISNKSYQLILSTLGKYSEVEEVIIFGSRAKGNYKQGSDIDLAIKGKDCNERFAMKISALLNEELPIPYHLDILCYDTLNNKELKEHIDRVGKIFFQANQQHVLMEPHVDFKIKSK
ncbi:MAG: nucleotidyltransferase domain-containing protein [Chitinophagaceae bacterium]|jgi:predicted nucleotidyltransferase|nr:nucleotidyltransferase domain-containing protein [Chitinophagaceae bacterium]